MASFENRSPDQVCKFLKEQIPNISDSVLDKIVLHKVDGEVFLAIDDEYLREIAPLVGDRFKVKKAIGVARSISSLVRLCVCMLSQGVFLYTF